MYSSPTTTQTSLVKLLSKRRAEEVVLESQGTGSSLRRNSQVQQSPDFARWYQVGQRYHYATSNWRQLFADVDADSQDDSTIHQSHTPRRAVRHAFKDSPTPTTLQAQGTSIRLGHHAVCTDQEDATEVLAEGAEPTTLSGYQQADPIAACLEPVADESASCSSFDSSTILPAEEDLHQPFKCTAELHDPAAPQHLKQNFGAACQVADTSTARVSDADHQVSRSGSGEDTAEGTDQQYKHCEQQYQRAHYHVRQAQQEEHGHQQEGRTMSTARLGITAQLRCTQEPHHREDLSPAVLHEHKHGHKEAHNSLCSASTDDITHSAIHNSPGPMQHGCGLPDSAESCERHAPESSSSAGNKDPHSYCPALTPAPACSEVTGTLCHPVDRRPDDQPAAVPSTWVAAEQWSQLLSCPSQPAVASADDSLQSTAETRQFQQAQAMAAPAPDVEGASAHLALLMQRWLRQGGSSADGVVLIQRREASTLPGHHDGNSGPLHNSSGCLAEVRSLQHADDGKSGSGQGERKLAVVVPGHDHTHGFEHDAADVPPLATAETAATAIDPTAPAADSTDLLCVLATGPCSAAEAHDSAACCVPAGHGEEPPHTSLRPAVMQDTDSPESPAMAASGSNGQPPAVPACQDSILIAEPIGAAAPHVCSGAAAAAAAETTAETAEARTTVTEGGKDVMHSVPSGNGPAELTSIDAVAEIAAVTNSTMSSPAWAQPATTTVADAALGSDCSHCVMAAACALEHSTDLVAPPVAVSCASPSTDMHKMCAAVPLTCEPASTLDTSGSEATAAVLLACSCDAHSTFPTDNRSDSSPVIHEESSEISGAYDTAESDSDLQADDSAASFAWSAAGHGSCSGEESGEGLTAADATSSGHSNSSLSTPSTRRTTASSSHSFQSMASNRSGGSTGSWATCISGSSNAASFFTANSFYTATSGALDWLADMEELDIDAWNLSPRRTSDAGLSQPPSTSPHSTFSPPDHVGEDVPQCPAHRAGQHSSSHASTCNGHGAVTAGVPAGRADEGIDGYASDECELDLHLAFAGGGGEMHHIPRLRRHQGHLHDQINRTWGREKCVVQ